MSKSKTQLKIGEKIHAKVEHLIIEETKINESGNKSAAVRARKLLMEIKQLASQGRQEVQDAVSDA